MIAFLKLSNGVNSLYLANFSFNLWISYKYYDLWSNRLLSSRTAENGFRVDVTSMTSVFALLRSNTDMLCSALIVSLMIGSLCKYEPYYLRVSFSLALFIVCSTRMMPNEPYCRAYCLAFVTLVNVLIDWIFLESSDLNRHLLPAHWVMKPALISSIRFCYSFQFCVWVYRWSAVIYPSVLSLFCLSLRNIFTKGSNLPRFYFSYSS